MAIFFRHPLLLPPNDRVGRVHGRPRARQARPLPPNGRVGRVRGRPRARQALPQGPPGGVGRLPRGRSRSWGGGVRPQNTVAAALSPPSAAREAGSASAAGSVAEVGPCRRRRRRQAWPRSPLCAPLVARYRVTGGRLGGENDGGR
ncbi:hypothetical protein BU14_0072s0068 [Porphyra umbilicalis]|uniref:Uncharacterized protein n=1 Tax=Porphyra umbilicalis TaxID=2786 RepID=A0A1X6PFT2_PORUM|nr:hypothetical protein BU14_0072s0068 [Porphyra umbilicalis]|eukprot:OSX79709.1 hypothetical protein BU14_0072s0068 [Porphyra umbilicalis]